MGVCPRQPVLRVGGAGMTVVENRATEQRTMLRKSGKQLFMDEIDQLTTSGPGHTDLAEIGNVGHSELLSTCELLGGRTLRIL